MLPHVDGAQQESGETKEGNNEGNDVNNNDNSNSTMSNSENKNADSSSATTGFLGTPTTAAAAASAPEGSPDTAALLRAVECFDEGKRHFLASQHKEALCAFREALSCYERFYQTEWHADVARAINSIAIVLGSQGDYESALREYRRALVIKQRVYGTDEHVDVAKTIGDMADVFWMQGDYAGALREYGRALAIKLRAYGTDEHGDVAATIGNMAVVLRIQGDYEGALREHRRALAIKQRVYGTDEHADVAKAINSIAIVLENQGDYESALREYRRALVIKQRVYGTDEHADVATTIGDMAGVLRIQGDYAGALREYGRALAIKLRAYGTDEHGDVAATIGNMAVVLRIQGDYEGALREHRRALAIKQRVYGTDEHASVASTIGDMAAVFYEQGDYNGALHEYRRALAIGLRAYGTDEHGNVAATIGNMAVVLRTQGDYEGALREHRRALAIKQRVYGTTEHAEVAGTIGNIAIVLKDQGNYESALREYQRALAIKQRVYGTDEHVSVAGTINNIAVLLSVQGDYSGALREYRRALAIKQRVYGTDEHTDVAATVGNIASVLKDQGDYDGALREYRRALAIKQRMYGTDEHADVAITIGDMAGVLEDQGDYEGALREYRRALAIKQRVFGTDEHASVAATIANIATMLADQGDYNGALHEYRRALTIQQRVYGTDEHIDVATTINNIASVLKDQGDYAAALQEFDRARLIYARVHHPAHYHHCLMLRNCIDAVGFAPAMAADALVQNVSVPTLTLVLEGLLTSDAIACHHDVLRELSHFEQLAASRPHTDFVQDVARMHLRCGDAQRAAEFLVSEAEFLAREIFSQPPRGTEAKSSSNEVLSKSLRSALCVCTPLLSLAKQICREHNLRSLETRARVCQARLHCETGQYVAALAQLRSAAKPAVVDADDPQSAARDSRADLDVARALRDEIATKAAEEFACLDEDMVAELSSFGRNVTQAIARLADELGRNATSSVISERTENLVAETFVLALHMLDKSFERFVRAVSPRKKERPTQKDKQPEQKNYFPAAVSTETGLRRALGERGLAVPPFIVGLPPRFQAVSDLDQARKRLMNEGVCEKKGKASFIRGAHPCFLLASLDIANGVELSSAAEKALVQLRKFEAGAPVNLSEKKPFVLELLDAGILRRHPLSGQSIAISAGLKDLLPVKLVDDIERTAAGEPLPRLESIRGDSARSADGGVYEWKAHANALKSRWQPFWVRLRAMAVAAGTLVEDERDPNAAYICTESDTLPPLPPVDGWDEDLREYRDWFQRELDKAFSEARANLRRAAKVGKPDDVLRRVLTMTRFREAGLSPTEAWTDKLYALANNNKHIRLTKARMSGELKGRTTTGLIPTRQAAINVDFAEVLPQLHQYTMWPLLEGSLAAAPALASGDVAPVARSTVVELAQQANRFWQGYLVNAEGGERWGQRYFVKKRLGGLEFFCPSLANNNVANLRKARADEVRQTPGTQARAQASAHRERCRDMLFAELRSEIEKYDNDPRANINSRGEFMPNLMQPGVIDAMERFLETRVMRLAPAGSSVPLDADFQLDLWSLLLLVEEGVSNMVLTLSRCAQRGEFAIKRDADAQMRILSPYTRLSSACDGAADQVFVTLVAQVEALASSVFTGGNDLSGLPYQASLDLLVELQCCVKELIAVIRNSGDTAPRRRLAFAKLLGTLCTLSSAVGDRLSWLVVRMLSSGVKMLESCGDGTAESRIALLRLQLLRLTVAVPSFFCEYSTVRDRYAAKGNSSASDRASGEIHPAAEEEAALQTLSPASEAGSPSRSSPQVLLHSLDSDDHQASAAERGSAVHSNGRTGYLFDTAQDLLGSISADEPCWNEAAASTPGLPKNICPADANGLRWHLRSLRDRRAFPSVDPDIRSQLIRANEQLAELRYDALRLVAGAQDGDVLDRRLQLRIAVVAVEQLVKVRHVTEHALHRFMDTCLCGPNGYVQLQVNFGARDSSEKFETMLKDQLKGSVRVENRVPEDEFVDLAFAQFVEQHGDVMTALRRTQPFHADSASASSTIQPQEPVSSWLSDLIAITNQAKHVRIELEPEHELLVRVRAADESAIKLTTVDDVLISSCQGIGSRKLSLLRLLDTAIAETTEVVLVLAKAVANSKKKQN